jgi:AcrR family transcriptional regulator
MSPDPAPGSLRARKAARTREAIVAAAVTLFDEQGYDRTSVAQIAARADIGERTFFRYFADKEEVLFGDDDELLEVIDAELAPATPGEAPATAAVRAARSVAARLAEWAALLPARERVIAATPALQARSLLKHARCAAVAAQALAGRYGMPAERAVVLARVVQTCAVAAYEQWCAEPDGGGLPARLDQAFAVAAVELAPFAIPG